MQLPDQGWPDAEIGSSFSSAARLKILHILAQAPRSVESIAEITGESVGNTSQHLQRLLRAGLLAVTKEKLSRIYRLRDERVAILVEDLFELAESLSSEFKEAEHGITDVDFILPGRLDEILKQVRGSKAALIDVREKAETEGSPVEGAIEIPAKQLKARAASLPKGKIYFIFCRGRACTLASEGVKILRSMGFTAYRLKESPAALRRKSR